jgi:hypothetical protein
LHRILRYEAMNNRELKYALAELERVQGPKAATSGGAEKGAVRIIPADMQNKPEK